MNAWLATIVGDTAAPIVGIILLFILVILLLLLVFAVLRRMTGGTFVAGGRNRQVRLSVTDAAAVDNRRRLVLVRRDDVEHLIMIGGPSDLVIEQNIKQFAKQPSRVEPVVASVAEPEARPEPKPEPKIESKPVEPPLARPVAASPQAVTPTPRPAPPVQAPPHIPLRPPVDQPEPPRQQAAPAPVAPEPAQPAAPVVTPPFIAPQAEAPIVSAPSRDAGSSAGSSWERTASPSFGTQARAEPTVETPPFKENPVKETLTEPRATTAAAFPFDVRNEPAAAPAYREPTLDNIDHEATDEPEITLADMDFDDAFDADLSEELDVVPAKETARPKADSIEDEMERLLGDLSRPEKR